MAVPVTSRRERAPVARLRSCMGGRLLLAMIERCVRDAGGTYMCCDTDALIIVGHISRDCGISACWKGVPKVGVIWNIGLAN